MGRKKLSHDEQLASMARRLKFYSKEKKGHRIWHGSVRFDDGRGQLHSDIEGKRTITAIRAACIVKHGLPQRGQVAKQVCDTPLCIEHVEWGKRS